jgi:hypothetical protein
VPKPPPALPELRGPGFALFRAVWLLALAAAVAAPSGGAWLRLARRGFDPSAADVARLAIDLVPPVLLIATAILLYLRRRRDMVAALLSLSFLLMAGAFFAAEGFFRELGLTWLRDGLANAGRCVLLLVLLTFPDGRFSPRWTAWAALLLVAWGPIALIRPFPLDVEYLGYLVLLAVSVLAIAVRYRRLAAGRERQQIRWVLFGFALGTALLCLAMAATFVRDAFAGDEGVRLWSGLAAQSLAALGMACFALGLLVSLLRYRLYDADALISRSAAYAAITLLIGAIFAGTANAIEKIVETGLGRDAGAAAAAAAAAVAVIVVTPAYHRIHGWADRRFQRALVELRRELPPCVEDMRETEPMGELLDEVLTRIVAGVRSLRAAVLLLDGEGRPGVAAAVGVDPAQVEAWRTGWTPAAEGTGLDCDTGDALFPLRIRLDADRRRGRGTVGWIALGPRPDGSFYGKDEQEALAEIANPVARAVQIVGLREQREAAARAEAGALEARMAALEERVAAGRTPARDKGTSAA